MTAKKKKPPEPALMSEQRETFAFGVIKTPIQAAETAVTYFRAHYKDCFPELTLELTKQVAAVNKGDMSTAEGLLISQAYTLDAIYNRLAQRAMSQEYIACHLSVLR